MINKITGKLTTLFDEKLYLEVLPFEYEILIPEYTRRQLQEKTGQTVSLYTIHYIDGGQVQTKMIPRLIGFLSIAEREFFELFCTVKGIGTRMALKAMVRPVREIAASIEEQNVKFLSGLPGIGPATAERIVASLRRKVPKFALMVDRNEPGARADQPIDVVTETFQALLSLGHSETDARRLIDGVLEGSGKYKTSTDLIQAIYSKNK